MTALAVAYKVRRHVLEDRVQGLELWGSNELFVGIASRKVVFVEDLILTSRDCSDCQHQPSLVGVVLPHSVDARGDLESLQIHEQLLHEHLLARGLDAYPENDLGLVQVEDVVLLDQE